MITKDSLKSKMADLVGRQIVAVSIDYDHDADDDFNSYLQVESTDFPPVRLPLEGLDYYVKDYVISNFDATVDDLHDEDNTLKLVDFEEEPIISFELHRLSAKWRTELFLLRDPLAAVDITPGGVSFTRGDGLCLDLHYGENGFKGVQVGALPDIKAEDTHTVRMTTANGMEVGLVFG